MPRTKVPVHRGQLPVTAAALLMSCFAFIQICRARNGQQLPQNVAKLKRYAYDKLREAHDKKKRQASKLGILDFATALKTTAAGPSPKATNLRGQPELNFDYENTIVSVQDRQSIPFSSDTMRGLAPGLINNFAEGTSATQPRIEEASEASLPMLEQASQHALAPGLVVNFAEGTTFLPMLEQTSPQALAPGLLDNFAEGTASFSPTLGSHTFQQALASASSGPDRATDAFSFLY